jgi:hypothetical protein
MNILNQNEQVAAEKLKSIDHDSIWGIAIRNVMAAFEASKFRRLICDLKSQNHDCPEVMKNILGDAYECVIAL